MYARKVRFHSLSMGVGKKKNWVACMCWMAMFLVWIPDFVPESRPEGFVCSELRSRYHVAWYLLLLTQLMSVRHNNAMCAQLTREESYLDLCGRAIPTSQTPCASLCSLVLGIPC